MKNCTGIFCPMQYGKLDPATCQAVDYCPQAMPPKTNADCIRAMSDEELAEYLDGVCHDFWQMFVKDPKKMWLDWLKQENNVPRLLI